MNREELLWFRDNIAFPKMQELLQNTIIPEGYFIITSLDVTLLDGRSCGVESVLSAKGLLYQNGSVQDYVYQTQDFEDSDFFETHKSCVFLSDGELHVSDALQEMDVSTVLRNLSLCADLFPQLKPAKALQVENEPLEYLKMRQLAQSENHPSLQKRIQSAAIVKGETALRDGKLSDLLDPER